MNPLLMALMQAMQQQPAQPGVRGRAPTARTSALARAMAHRDSKAQQAKHLSLPALPPYAESDHADRIGGTPGTPQTGAFQTDAFENDAFQVDGVV